MTSGLIDRGAGARSPVPAIAGGLMAGVALAVALLLTVAADGSEPVVTGSILLAFGFGWGLMALLSARFSGQPQAWTVVPAVALGATGVGLLLLQPGPGAMDVLGWIWPPAIAGLAIWMIVQVRRQLRGRGRWLVVPTIATLLAFSIGGALAAVGAGSAAAGGTGRLIEVDGRDLYIECTGTGSPVVVLQAGLGESSAYWSRIAPSVAATTTVCAYDRAGHGHSDLASGPQDGIALAADLRALLEGAGVSGPYVLVGHSSGGPYVRVFADRYPDLVAGMVLLDAQPGDPFTALPDYPAFYKNMRLAAIVSPSLARVGLLGLILGLSADQSTTAAARGARDEILALPTVLDQARALTSIGDRPLIVVTAGAGPQDGWIEAQEALTDLSTDSVQRRVDAATHSSLITGPEAAESTQAILDAIDAVRTGTAVR